MFVLRLRYASRIRYASTGCNRAQGTELQAATRHIEYPDLYIRCMSRMKRGPRKFALVTRKRDRLDSLALSLDAAPC